MNYYNEWNAYAAQWLRELISAGIIPRGIVDQRSITDVTPGDLSGFAQCHFFAGIGGWPLALKLAGIDPSTRLWTGSCPCQPFSAAGQRKGTADERHLWPVFRDLIAQCRPPVVFGEQVASADGRAWLSTVRSEMEAMGYAVGAADLCAACIGAPHIRQRLYFVGLADAACELHNGGRNTGQGRRDEYSDGSSHGRLADTRGNGRKQGGSGAALLALPGKQAPAQSERREQAVSSERGSRLRGLADTDDAGPQGSDREYAGAEEREDAARHPGPLCAADDSRTGRPSPPDGFWSNADWLFCRDGKWRPVESNTFPLANGIPGRVGRLRAYGNAIVPQVAAAFILAALPERKTD